MNKIKSKDQSIEPAWNIVTGATAFGCSRDKMTAVLKAAGIKVGPGERYSTKQIHHALMGGDSRKERMLLTKARRRLVELNLRERERDLIPFEEAASFIRDNFVPRREFVVSQSGRLAAIINPGDPAHARAILDKDCDQYLKLKEKYPAREVEKKET